MAEFIAAQEHRYSLRKKECRQEIPLLLRAEAVYGLIAGRPFDPAIPTHVVIVAIAVFFAVCLVVFALVADEIAQGESVVASYEIQTGTGAATVVRVEITATGQPAGQFCNRTAIAF